MSSAQNITIRDDDFWRARLTAWRRALFCFTCLGQNRNQRLLVQRLLQIMGLATWVDTPKSQKPWKAKRADTLSGKSLSSDSGGKDWKMWPRWVMHRLQQSCWVLRQQLSMSIMSGKQVNTKWMEVTWKAVAFVVLIAQGKKLQRASSAPQAGNLNDVDEMGLVCDSRAPDLCRATSFKCHGRSSMWRVQAHTWSGTSWGFESTELDVAGCCWMLHVGGCTVAAPLVEDWDGQGDGKLW